MWIAAINHLHNGSLCLYHHNKLIFYIEEERLSRNKYDGFVYLAINKIKEYTNHIDQLAICGYSNDEYKSLTYSNCSMSLYASLFKKHNLIDKNTRVKEYYSQHHLTHAALAFYNSGFENAAVIVVDGGGSEVSVKGPNHIVTCYEKETIFAASYPSRFDTRFKSLYSNEIEFSVNTTSCNSKLSIGNVFEHVNMLIGFDALDSGKTMGLSTYGKTNNQISEYDFFNRDVYRNDFSNIPKEDIAYKAQKTTEQRLNHLIKMAKRANKNIILTGGYALNCVSNYNIIKNNKDINLYVEPISHDGGTCLGAAQLMYREATESKEVNKIKNIYYGFNYDIPNIDNLKDTSYDEIANHISNKKIVAIYQGRSEAGPRALGNRSILYDPRDINGRDTINKVKNREWFRPFAGSILQEHFSDWFNCYSLDESPFMMYAVDVKSSKKDIIPAILHIDNTCRVQTVKKENNNHYYNLINKFYELTGVPILFNTSFNLAGEPLVETVDDALKTFYNSEIDFLYFPEHQKVVAK